jgi:hypothetical protein
MKQKLSSIVTNLFNGVNLIAQKDGQWLLGWSPNIIEVLLKKKKRKEITHQATDST